jgi:hypothetical protein
MSEPSEELKIVEDAADRLAEHWDSVLILCTRHNDATKLTRDASTGRGNFAAQIGSAKEWVIRQDAKVVEHSKQEDR